MTEAIDIRRDTGSSTALVSGAMTAGEVVQQVQLIQQIMAKVMQRGVHYDVVPGCGDKPALLQPGAQKIAMTFRLVPEYIIEREDLPGGHREYEVQCFLSTADGRRIGHGIGNCSTMETKYRYRQQVVSQNVPKEWWDTHDKALIGGEQFSVQKRGGKWCIVEQVEAPNPADYANTVKKMATKRAYVHAVIQATACGDLFTQDLEEDPELYHDGAGDEAAPSRREPPPRPQRKSAPQPQQQPQQQAKDTPGNTGAGSTVRGFSISDGQRKLLFAKLRDARVSEDAFKAYLREEFGSEHTADIPGDSFDDVLYAVAHWNDARPGGSTPLDGPEDKV